MLDKSRQIVSVHSRSNEAENLIPLIQLNKISVKKMTCKLTYFLEESF